jgi:hypothetical protein
VLRAAELFFRPQRVSIHEGRALMADAEVIEAHETRSPSPLVAMLGPEPVAELDVLDDGTPGPTGAARTRISWLSTGARGRSREGLARRWRPGSHTCSPSRPDRAGGTVSDRDWRWFVGLDAEATRIGNALWRGEDVDSDARGRMLALFRLASRPGAPVEPRVAGTRCISCSP